MNSELFFSILGSSVISAIISSYFAFRVNRKNQILSMAKDMAIYAQNNSKNVVIYEGKYEIPFVCTLTFYYEISKILSRRSLNKADMICLIKKHNEFFNIMLEISKNHKDIK